MPTDIPASTETRIDGQIISVAVRKSVRARNYRLSVSHRGTATLTVPRTGRWREAQAFLDRQAAWLAARLKRAQTPITLAVGSEIPLRGVNHLIEGLGAVRGQVTIGAGDPPRLLVPGAPAHQPRRLKDWLKSQAKADLVPCVAHHTSRLGVTAHGVSVRDQAARWGSCSSAGRLNFNWRLILAPPFVLDYVAAHEVAHLIEMNHSPDFWATVERTLPDMARGRAWLRAHGRQLMAYS